VFLRLNIRLIYLTLTILLVDVMGFVRVYLIVSLAFAFFIMCPRMAGMCAVIAKVKGVNPYVVAIVGGVMSVPLIVLMVYLTIKVGVYAAIIAAVATDILASIAMGTFRLKYAVEVAIIALFIWVGVAVASRASALLTSLIAKG